MAVKLGVVSCEEVVRGERNRSQDEMMWRRGKRKTQTKRRKPPWELDAPRFLNKRRLVEKNYEEPR